MKVFPERVRAAMRANNGCITCIPIRVDDGVWKAAVFFRLMGPECKQDRRILAKTKETLPVALEAELLEQAHAAVVVLRFEVYTLPDNPLVGEILLTPGAVTTHFTVLRLLSQQRGVYAFFCDQDFRILHAQQQTLLEEQQAGFDNLRRDAVSHDALIRCSGRYDAQAALSEVVAHYAVR